jgi:hypothetical protein
LRRNARVRWRQHSVRLGRSARSSTGSGTGPALEEPEIARPALESAWSSTWPLVRNASLSNQVEH